MNTNQHACNQPNNKLIRIIINNNIINHINSMIDPYDANALSIFTYITTIVHTFIFKLLPIRTTIMDTVAVNLNAESSANSRTQLGFSEQNQGLQQYVIILSLAILNHLLVNNNNYEVAFQL